MDGRTFQLLLHLGLEARPVVQLPHKKGLQYLLDLQQRAWIFSRVKADTVHGRFRPGHRHGMRSRCEAAVDGYKVLNLRGHAGHRAPVGELYLGEAGSEEGGLVGERPDEAAAVALAKQAHGKALPGGVADIVGIQDQHARHLQHEIFQCNGMHVEYSTRKQKLSLRSEDKILAKVHACLTARC